MHFNKRLGAYTWKEHDSFSERNFDDKVFYFHERALTDQREYGAHFVFYTSVWTWTRGIDIAVGNENLTLVRAMCSWGANIQACDEDCPLAKAVYKGNSDMVDCLLSFGADVNHNDKFNETPLITACMTFGNKRAPPVMSLLLDNGANIEQSFYFDKDETALVCAIAYANIEAAEMLIDRGAKCTMLDYNSQNVIDLFVFWYLIRSRLEDGNTYTERRILDFFRKLKERGIEISDSDIVFRAYAITRNKNDPCCHICSEEGRDKGKERHNLIPCAHSLCTECYLETKQLEKCVICGVNIIRFL